MLPRPPTGIGNITNNPLFVNPANLDFRLRPNSPCINSGNNLNIPSGTDLDNNTRIAGQIVDMGAYEFQNPLSTIPGSWLAQYGLDVNATVDTDDPDLDGVSNWQEWRTGTNPKDPSSVFKLLTPAAVAGTCKLTWLSVTNRFYFVERSEMGTPNSFVTIASNQPGRNAFTTYNDRIATNGIPYFYRVGVYP
jgi:hypothetical protein